MKKLLFILGLCFSVFATAQCPVVNLPQNAKWYFNFSQCFHDTTTHTYVTPSRIAYFDGNKNLTTISFPQLLDSLNVPEIDTNFLATQNYVNHKVDSLGAITGPSGNNHNIQFNSGGAFGASTDFNYNGTVGVFYIYDLNGDTLFSVNTQTREIRNFGRMFMPNMPDSAVVYYGPNGELKADSVRFVWREGVSGGLYLKNIGASPLTGALNIVDGAESLGRINHTIIANPTTSTPTYNFFKARGIGGIPTATQSSRLGVLNFGGYTGTAWVTGPGSIRGQSPATWTATSFPVYFEILTNTYNNLEQRSSYFTHAGTFSTGFGATKDDTTYTLNVFGSARITQTARNYDLTDSLVSKDDSTGEIRTWLPARLFALKGDSNFFGAITTNSQFTSTTEVSAAYYRVTNVGNGVIFGANGRIKLPDGNGIFEITNNTENGLNRINLGDNTALVPSIKVVGNDVHIRLGDDSDSSGLVADTVTCSVLNAGTIVGLTSGTFTPSTFNGANISASTPQPFTFTRVGNVVTFAGSVQVTTTAALASELGISLPIASAMTLATDANGSGNPSSAIAQNVYVIGDATNDRLSLNFLGLAISGSGTIYVSGQYQIK